MKLPINQRFPAAVITEQLKLLNAFSMHFILISFPAQKKSRKCDTLDGFGFILHKNNYRFFAAKSKHN